MNYYRRLEADLHEQIESNNQCTITSKLARLNFERPLLSMLFN